MRIARACLYLIILIVALMVGAYCFALVSNAQTVVERNVAQKLQPSVRRALVDLQEVLGQYGRPGGYAPAQQRTPQVRVTGSAQKASAGSPSRTTRTQPASAASLPAISPGTPLSTVLHTAQVSLTSAAGSDEQFVDSNFDLIANRRTTFDNDGGSFDIAVGQSGARYEVFSATLQGANVGVLVVALDTNADYIVNTSSTYDLHRDFSLPSAAAVVTGTSKAGREFVIATIQTTSRHRASCCSCATRAQAALTTLGHARWSQWAITNSITRTLLLCCRIMIC